MKRKSKAKKICAVLSVICLLAAVIFELMPIGAAMIFMSSPDEPYIYEFYSYFSLVPFGYAYFTPLLTAFASVLMLATAAFGLFGRNLHRVLYTVLCSVTIFLPIVQAVMYHDRVCPASGAISLFIIIGVVLNIIGKQIGDDYEV